MIESALKYIKQGYSVIPTFKDKSPSLGTWAKYQKDIMTPEVAKNVFVNAHSIAIISGGISKNRLVVDVDCKYDITGKLWTDLVQLIKDNDEDLFDKLVVVKTPSGGYHIIFNTKKLPSRSTKLANRPLTDNEKEENPKEKCKVLIETKGEGGYCLAPPSKGYKYLSKREKPIILTDNEVDLILTASRSFNQVFEEKKVNTKKAFDNNIYTENPFDDYNNRGDCIEILESSGWKVVSQTNRKIYLKRPGDSSAKTSGNFSLEHNRFYCFSTSTEFESDISYSPVAIYCLIKHGNDWKKCVKDLIDSGFGRERKKISSAYSKLIKELVEDGIEDADIIDEIRKVGGKSIEDCEIIFENFRANQGKTVLQFWYIKDGSPPSIKIHLTKFVRFISNHLNIYRYKLSGAETIFRYIRITGNIIEEVKLTDVKDEIKDYINSLESVFDGIYRDSLMEIVQRQSNILFSDTQMEFLEYTDVEVLRPEKDSAFFPFKNCMVKISKDKKIECLDYKALGKKVIWRSSIINHEFDIDFDFEEFSFTKFLSKINDDDDDRINYCKQLVGYSLHEYKDEMKPFSVIFGEESADSLQGGGTGKGLLTKAIDRVIKTITIDGKGFQADKPFAFQRVTLDCKLILLQDTEKNFKFESLFSKITDGLTIERKNKDELFLNYEDSPKFLITTNYNIDNSSQASNRRQILLEFSNFFNDKNTPIDYLGEYLFIGWEKKQWDKFYTVMFDCIIKYLDEGITEVKETDTSRQKKVTNSFTEMFYEWFSSYVSVSYTSISDLHDNFLIQSDISIKAYSRIRFSKALQFSCNVFDIELKSHKAPVTNKKLYFWGKNEPKPEEPDGDLPF